MTLNLNIGQKKGITAICTTIKSGEMKSFQELKTTHDLMNQDLFRYLQMRDYYIKRIKTTEDKIHPIIKLLVQAYSQTIPKAVAVLNGCLMNSRLDSTLYVKTKWERELGEEIPEGIWYDMWKNTPNYNTISEMEGIQLEKFNSILYYT